MMICVGSPLERDWLWCWSWESGKASPSYSSLEQGRIQPHSKFITSVPYLYHRLRDGRISFISCLNAPNLSKGYWFPVRIKAKQVGAHHVPICNFSYCTEKLKHTENMDFPLFAFTLLWREAIVPTAQCVSIVYGCLFSDFQKYNQYQFTSLLNKHKEYWFSILGKRKFVFFLAWKWNSVET